MPSADPMLSVVVPLKDEADNLVPLADRLGVVLTEVTSKWEVILVDDGSRDETYTRALALNDSDPRFKIIRLSRNFGHQIALSAGGGENKIVLDIAAYALTGEIADRSGQDDAASHFEEAVKLQDSFNYTEPPQWYYPVRHSLGAVLLRQGKAAEAERVYREDLKSFPENGWALFGLVKALQARGRAAEARAVEARFRKAWAGADVMLTASRF